MFQALLDLNIVYKSKYYDVLHLEHGLYAKFVLRNYIENIKSEMTRMEKLGYRLFCRSERSFLLGNRYGSMPVVTDWGSKKHGKWIHRKDSFQWEYAELYFDVESQVDMAKDMVY